MNDSDSYFPIATALRSGLKGYNLISFGKDIIAGFVVSLVALPLAMALSIAVGLPPQHGIYTAIVAGIATALFGGSMTQVSGPTAAFVVIVAPIVTEYGLHGLIWCQIIAGVILILMGIARLGRYIHYVPYPVTTGFTAGIAVVIATLALNDFLGLNLGQLPSQYVGKIASLVMHLPLLNQHEFTVGMVTLLVIILFARFSRALPSPVIGIAAGTALAYYFGMNGHEIATIGSRFSYYTAGGLLEHGIPPFPPELHLPSQKPGDLFSIPDAAEFKILLIPAIVVAALAALESLLSATVADSMAGTKHNPNAELNGIGIGNILSGLAGGIPATGAIARTAANIHAGAKTPIASVIHAILILLYVVSFAPLINHIPMASLSALLLVVAYKMSHFRQFFRTLKIAPASDIIVLLTCFSLTVFIDMVAGVAAGIILSSLLFLKHISDLTQMGVASLDGQSEQLKGLHLPEGTMIYSIDGPVFFGTVEKIYSDYEFVHDYIDRVIIDMEKVPLIDMTGLVAMKVMLNNIAKERREVIICCGRKEVTKLITNKIAAYDFARLVKFTDTVREALNPADKK